MPKTKKSYAIIGCGRFGSSLAYALSELDQEVLLVDEHEEKVNEMSEYVTYSVCADVSKEGALDNIGLHNVDCAIVAMSSNFEASIMATTICKEKEIATIIAKAKSTLHARILHRVGADKVILPEKEIGTRLAHSLANPSFFEHINMSDEFSMEDFPVPDSWIGKSAYSLKIRSNYKFSIVGIRNAKGFNINPDPAVPFQEGDIIYALGRSDDFKELHNIFKK